MADQSRQQEVHQQADRLLADIQELLKGCSENIAQNKVVNLAPLNQPIQQFCQIIAQMPENDARHYQPHLEAMLEQTRNVKLQLDHQMAALKHQVTVLGHQRKAQMAYVKSSALKKEGSADGD